jgi:hypothetical protein
VTEGLQEVAVPGQVEVGPVSTWLPTWPWPLGAVGWAAGCARQRYRSGRS